jgi:phenylpropionate dioxygenase-like ring-hydroxylating dioxygenase large terminal subunit
VRWLTNTDPALRAAWHPVARVGDVGDGPLGVRLLGEAWAVARLGGRLVALEDRCPHRLAPLSAGRVEGDTLQCRYHGWRFGGDGACVAIPATGPDVPVPPRARCATASVVEHLGLVWLAPETPRCPLPDLPELDDPHFGPVELPPQTWRASAAQMADNFLDVAHFPFTHAGTIGDPDDRLVHPYEVEREGWVVRAVHRHRAKALVGEAAPDGPVEEVIDREMGFTLTAPHHVVLRLDYGRDGRMVLAFFHQPVDDDTTVLWCLQAAENVADGRVPTDEARAFQLRVAAEDRDLLERLEPKAVPLDLTAEVHTRADRITVELRRMLADLVAAGAR